MEFFPLNQSNEHIASTNEWCFNQDPWISISGKLDEPLKAGAEVAMGYPWLGSSSEVNGIYPLNAINSYD